MTEITRRLPADTRPASWNEDDRTFEAVMSTGAAVRRRDARGPFTEMLDLSRVDLSALAGLPVLDSHRQGSARDAIGTVISAKREGGAIVARIRLGSAGDITPIAERARDGLLSVSIGYREAGRSERLDGAERVVTVTPSIFEASLVAVPADRHAKIRSGHMPDNEIESPNLAPEMPAADQARIRSLGELADLPPSFADAQIAAGATVEEARTAARAAMIERSRQTPTIRVTASQDDPAVITRRQTDALSYRAAGGQLPADARQYVEMSFRDLATDALSRAGISTRGMGADEIFQRAALGTSDFPLVVSNAANKIALDRYNAAASALTPLVRQRTLPNFKPSTAIRLGELGELKPLSEHGEIQHTSRAESGESMQLATYAEGLNVSRKLLIDDDAGLFGDITAALGDAAAATVATKLAGLLLSPGALSDGQAVFHSTRGNLAGTGTAITVAALTAGRKAMRTVKGLDGVTIVGAAPRYIVCGPDKETEAEQAVAAIYAATPEDVNPFSGRFQILVEPRLTGNQWFLFSDPTRLPVLQMAYLSAAQGVQIQRSEAWDTLGMRFRAFLDFGCGWTDWRGAYRNAGA